MGDTVWIFTIVSFVFLLADISLDTEEIPVGNVDCDSHGDSGNYDFHKYSKDLYSNTIERGRGGKWFFRAAFGIQ